MPDPDPRDDHELIEAANRGDADAFTALYYRYRDWVLRLALRFTHSHADALDVLQDAFTYLLRKFPGFRLSASMTTFLYPVVKNLSLKMLRRRRRDVSSDAILAGTAAPADTDAQGQRAELAEVMAALPEDQRETVLLRFVDGLSLAEVAEALRVPVGTVKSRLHHALRKLREDARTRRYFLGNGAQEASPAEKEQGEEA